MTQAHAEVAARLEAAEQLLSRGAALEAHAALLPLVEATGSEAVAGYRTLRAVAAAAQALGRLEEAERWLQRARPHDLLTTADLLLARLANALAAQQSAQSEQLERELGPALEAAGSAELTCSAAEVLASHGRGAAALALFAKVAGSTEVLLGARAAAGAAAVHALGGAFDEAARQLEAARARVGDEEAAAALSLQLGDVRLEQGLLADAERAYRAALPQARERALLKLAELQVSEGKLDEALASYEQGLAALRALEPEGPAVPAVLDSLASLHGRAGRMAEAQATLEQAVAAVVVARPADPMLEAHLRLRLGTLLLSTGVAATRAVVELQLAASRLGAAAGERHPSVAGVLNTLAVAQLQAADLAGAEQTAQRSLELAGDDDDPAGAALAHNSLALVAVARGEVQVARRKWERAKELFTRAGFEEQARGVEKNLAALP